MTTTPEEIVARVRELDLAALKELAITAAGDDPTTQDYADFDRATGPVTVLALLSILSEQTEEVERLADLLADYAVVHEDQGRLTRELDVAMHGEAGAALQASLCDLIIPARQLAAALSESREREKVLEGTAEFYCRLYGEALDALDLFACGDYWPSEWDHDELVPTWKGAKPVMDTAEEVSASLRAKIKERTLTPKPLGGEA